MSPPHTPASPPQRGRPKDLEKRDAIFEAARRLFHVQGYSNTSMQEIANAACVSKLTLYSHFEDKEDLFRQTLEGLGRNIRYDADLDTVIATQTAHEALLHVARFVMNTLINEESLAAQRTVLAEMRHFKHVSQAYVSAGLDGFLIRLESFLRAIVAKHPEYEIKDPHKAACHFYGLVKSDIHPRYLYEVNPPSTEDVEQHLQEIVDCFLNAHRAQ